MVLLCLHSFIQQLFTIEYVRPHTQVWLRSTRDGTRQSPCSQGMHSPAARPPCGEKSQVRGEPRPQPQTRRPRRSLGSWPVNFQSKGKFIQNPSPYKKKKKTRRDPPTPGGPTPSQTLHALHSRPSLPSARRRPTHCPQPGHPLPAASAGPQAASAFPSLPHASYTGLQAEGSPASAALAGPGTRSTQSASTAAPAPRAPGRPPGLLCCPSLLQGTDRLELGPTDTLTRSTPAQEPEGRPHPGLHRGRMATQGPCPGSTGAALGATGAPARPAQGCP